MAFTTFYVRPSRAMDDKRRVFKIHAPEGSYDAAQIQQALNFLDYFGWEEQDADGNYQGPDEWKLGLKP